MSENIKFAYKKIKSIERKCRSEQYHRPCLINMLINLKSHGIHYREHSDLRGALLSIFEGKKAWNGDVRLWVMQRFSPWFRDVPDYHCGRGESYKNSNPDWDEMPF